ncbi:helix-turn-helix domain-containing protein [Plantactinospora siamensis]|uniref:Helix-turn-helix domain-containing protein n=1 Tax=Plantactinospora siamensis TaxID=555372 RepID=A0ABV6P5G3_9ACTN
MSAPGFQGARLRMARELAGLSQAHLAGQIAVSPAAVSQFESGAARPRTETLNALSQMLDVPVAFFNQPLMATHEGFFRSLRRTAVADRRRARAVAHVAHDLAVHATAAGQFPTGTVPQIQVSNLNVAGEELERIAAQVREEWKLPSGPIGNVVDLLEHHGVVVIRLPLGSTDVDAFSLPFSDHPVVVLGTDKNDRARSRFDAAHELAHLVLHGEQIWGVKEVEKQAHTFAAAFLMPADEIADQLPDSVDWSRLFELKRYWQVSLAALLMRARTLGRMSEGTYLTAIKAASARGWRRVEPVPLGTPERPCHLLNFLTSTASDAARQQIPTSVISALAAAA